MQRAEGDYDGALASLRRTESTYPRDRVVLNESRKFSSVSANTKRPSTSLERVARIDPEDLQMQLHADALLSRPRRCGKADREETLFRRFKADESAQTITARIRRLSPEDNNERQPIHEHVSVELPAGLRVQEAGGPGSPRWGRVIEDSRPTFS